MNKKNLLLIFVLAFAAFVVSPDLASAIKTDQTRGEYGTAPRDWLEVQGELNDAPLDDYMIMYNAGGTDGSSAVIGIPSLRTYRHIKIGNDLHEPVFSGSNAGNNNGTPDGKWLYITDKGNNTLGVINLQTGYMERIIAFPFPFGIHHCNMAPNGKYMFCNGELTGKVLKLELATGRSQVIDVPPAPSAPDYGDVDRHGDYYMSGNYYHSTTMVFSQNPFKFIKEIPVGKNPHDHHFTPDDRWLFVMDKLSATVSIINRKELKVQKVVPTGAGPLHSVIDRKGKYDYQSNFVSDSVTKIDIQKQKVVDEFPIHYRVGHIAISIDDKFVFSLNKFSTGLFSPTGIVYPVNHEMLDADETSSSYGKTLKIIPVDGEPHNAKVLFSSIINRWETGKGEELFHKNLPNTGAAWEQNTVHAALNPTHYYSYSYVPRDTEKPGVRVASDGVKEVHIRGFSYGYAPRFVRVNKGDKVRIIFTNIDKAAGLTKNPDVTMGFLIHGHYGPKTHINSPRGISAMTEFVADLAGEYEFYCQHFCGPLHLEMRGTFFVDDAKKGTQASLGSGDYDEASKHKWLLEGEGDYEIEGGNAKTGADLSGPEHNTKGI